MDDATRFAAKFGPPPSAAALSAMPTHVVLVGQVIVCVALLVVVQPPFVLLPASDAGMPLTVCPTRVLVLALATAAATWTLHTCGAAPGDTFRGACELMKHLR